MNSPKFLPQTLMLVLFLTASPAHAEGETCPEYYSKLAKWGNDFIVSRFDPKKPMPHGPLEKFRDLLKSGLMNWKNRRYPILAMEDATALKANLLAKHALKDTANLEGAPFELAALKKEVNDLLATVEAYPTKYKIYLDDTATYAAQAEAMRDLNAAAEATKHDIKALLPVATAQADGKVTMEMKPRRWGTYAAFREDRSAAEEETIKRINATMVEAITETEQFALNQATDLKKLETYLQEYRYLTDKLGERKVAEVDADLKPIYDRIESLFDPGTNRFKRNVTPPPWAWNKLKWNQLSAELKTVWQRDRVQLTDNETTKKVMSYLKDLSPEELRLLGVDKLAAAIKVGQNNIYVRTLILGVVGAGGTGGLGTFAWNFGKELLSESAQKEACAAATSDDKFRQCVSDVLKQKFTVETVKAALFDQDTFLDETGKIKDPKVRRVVEDVVARRRTYQGSEKQKAENQEALVKEIKVIQAAEDPGSDAYRDKVITAPRKEAFLFGLSGRPEGTTTYLGFHHPGQLQKNRTLVENILTEDDEDKRSALLNDLRLKGAGDLADDMEDLLADRQDFLDHKYVPGGKRRYRRKGSLTLGPTSTAVSPDKDATERKTDKLPPERNDTN